jgi:signal transduction histidine kinase
MMSGLRKTSSIFSRIVTASMLIAVLAVTLLFGVTYATLERQMNASLKATVATDLAGLLDIHASSGQAELVRRIADRQAVLSIEGRRSHYLLARADGTPIAGDTRGWPPLSAALSEEGAVTLADGTPAYAHVARIGPDLQIMVAREYAEDRAALWRVSAIFLVVGTGIVAAVALVANATGQRLGERVETINESLRAAAEGRELQRLTPRRHERDEIDEMAGHAARLLSRQAQLVRSQKHLSDHIAHEVRTPLMHLDNQLVTGLNVRPEPQGAGPLSQSRQDIRMIVAMLDSLLDIASNESRRGDLAGLAQIDISALVADVAALYEGSAEDSGLDLVVDVVPGVIVMGERMQLTRLLSNLLDNAIKYVPRRGRIELKLSPGPRISVCDDGPGIAPQDRDRVFERFARGSGLLSPPGHGLGLALARAIALRHGLDLRLGDRGLGPEGRGACFMVEPT